MPRAATPRSRSSSRNSPRPQPMSSTSDAPAKQSRYARWRSAMSPGARPEHVLEGDVGRRLVLAGGAGGIDVDGRDGGRAGCRAGCRVPCRRREHGAVRGRGSGAQAVDLALHDSHRRLEQVERVVQPALRRGHCLEAGAHAGGRHGAVLRDSAQESRRLAVPGVDVRCDLLGVLHEPGLEAREGVELVAQKAAQAVGCPVAPPAVPPRPGSGARPARG